MKGRWPDSDISRSLCFLRCIQLDYLDRSVGIGLAIEHIRYPGLLHWTIKNVRINNGRATNFSFLFVALNRILLAWIDWNNMIALLDCHTTLTIVIIYCYWLLILRFQLPRCFIKAVKLCHLGWLIEQILLSFWCWLCLLGWQTLWRIGPGDSSTELK